MKRLYIAAAILGLLPLGVYAQKGMQGETPTAEWRINDFCNAEANRSKLKADKRKAFIKSCTEKTPACVGKADQAQLKGMAYISSVAACVKQ